MIALALRHSALLSSECILECGTLTTAELNKCCYINSFKLIKICHIHSAFTQCLRILTYTFAIPNQLPQKVNLG